jgi:hypothetical protein
MREPGGVVASAHAPPRQRKPAKRSMVVAVSLDDRHFDLALKQNAGLLQLLGEAFAVDGFEQASFYDTMQLDREADNAVCELSLQQHIASPWTFVVLRVSPCKTLRKNETGPDFSMACVRPRPSVIVNTGPSQHHLDNGLVNNHKGRCFFIPFTAVPVIMAAFVALTFVKLQTESAFCSGRLAKGDECEKDTTQSRRPTPIRSVQ